MREFSKKTIFSGLFWRFAERCGAQGVKLIVEIVLARLLCPEDYAVIALVSVFINIFNVFIDSGLANALIQKKDADDVDFSSVFFFNLFACVLLYVCLFIIAPSIGVFFGNTNLTNIIRVIGVTLVISGVKNVQLAYVSRNMLFKKFFVATLVGTIVAAIVGVSAAYLGLGVWALVWQQIVNTAIDTLVLWFIVRWRPVAKFSIARLKSLLDFGWKLLVSALINTIYGEIRTIIIGRRYSQADLAYYNQGNKYPEILATNINNSIDSVLLPTLSSEQDNITNVRKKTQLAIKVSMYLLSPIMIGVVCCAENFIQIFLTDKWLPCLFYMQIFCINYMFYPVHAINLSAMKSLGRSDLFLKLEIVKKIVGMGSLLVAMNISVKAMAITAFIVSIIAQLINSFPNKKLLNYGYFEQMKDVCVSVFLSILMALFIYPINICRFSCGIKLVTQIIVGIIIYLLGSIVLKLDAFNYVLEVIKMFFDKSDAAY